MTNRLSNNEYACIEQRAFKGPTYVVVSNNENKWAKKMLIFLPQVQRRA
jgi:hypothetical protein